MNNNTMRIFADVKFIIHNIEQQQRRKQWWDFQEYEKTKKIQKY